MKDDSSLNISSCGRQNYLMLQPVVALLFNSLKIEYQSFKKQM